MMSDRMLWFLSSGQPAPSREPEAVDACHGGDEQGVGVVLAPGEVVGRLGEGEPAEDGPGRVDHPDATRAAHEQVAGPVDLDAVDGVVAGLAGEITQERAI